MNILVNITFPLLCLQFFVCDIWSLGCWWPCCWLLFVCYWCSGREPLLEATPPFPTWSTCSPWWKGLLDLHSERARDITLVSNPCGVYVCLFYLFHSALWKAYTSSQPLATVYWVRGKHPFWTVSIQFNDFYCKVIRNIEKWESVTENFSLVSLCVSYINSIVHRYLNKSKMCNVDMCIGSGSCAHVQNLFAVRPSVAWWLTLYCFN